MQLTGSFSTTFSCGQNINLPDKTYLIPPEWKDLSGSLSKVLSKTARQLLSLIVTSLESEFGNTAAELQKSYHFFEERLAVGQRRVRQCFVELEQAGFVSSELVTVILSHIKCRNILSIKLLKDFKSFRAGNDNHNVKNFPASLKEFSREPAKNFRFTCKNFGFEKQNFQTHNIIDNNISILESRSSESSFVNFLEDDPSTSSNQKKGERSLDKNDDEHQDPPQGNSSNWLTKVASKAKDLCGLRKKLAEFHPLSEEDARFLQTESKREFNLGFINELLLKLAVQYPNHNFPNKKTLLNYMTKVLACELRDACKVNNVGFRFKQDADIKARETYLQEVEYSKDISRTSQLRRKIAAVFEPEVAYKLLTGCSFGEPQGDCYRLRLIRDIQVTQDLRDALLQEAKAVYGNSLNHLEIVPYEATGNGFVKNKGIVTEAADKYSHLQGLDSESAWFKIRKYLTETLGVAVDKAWFSKLDVVEEDQIAKRLVLKPQSSFFGSWIMQNYEVALQYAVKVQGFSFEMAKF